MCCLFTVYFSSLIHIYIDSLGVSSTTNLMKSSLSQSASTTNADNIVESADAKKWIRVAFGLEIHASKEILGHEFETQFMYPYFHAA